MLTLKKTFLLALVFVALYNLLFFNVGLGVGMGVLFLLLNLYFFLLKNKASKNIFWAVFASFAAVLFASLFAFRSNGIVLLVDCAAAVFFSLTALCLYKYEGSLFFKAGNFLALPFTAVFRSAGAFLNLFNAKTWAASSSQYQNTGSLIRGFLIAVPVFAVLLVLLLSADPIFAKMTGDIFKTLGERTLVSFLIYSLLLGFGFSVFSGFKEKEDAKVPSGKSHELAVITGSVISLFAVFIFIQFRYLFGTVSERELSRLGIQSLTYSEYVRKGFFELLIAAAISGGVLSYVLRYFDHLQDKLKGLVHIFSAILTIETMFLLLSALRRLMLYADGHGLTRARVFGFVFLLWLGILLAIFLFRLSKRVSRRWFLANILGATLLILLFINLFNIDGVIATLYKPTVNGEIDYYYLAGLSTDASGTWQEAVADAEATVVTFEGAASLGTEQNRQLYYRKATLEALLLKTNFLKEKYGTAGGKWQSFNLSEYLAFQKIAANQDDFAKIPVLLKRISGIEMRLSEEVIRNTRLDRSANPPLVPVR